MVETEPKMIDIGKLNNDLFIMFVQVVCLRMFHRPLDKDVKNALGNLSYYLKGMEQIPNLHKVPFRITAGEDIFEEDLYLYMIMNSAGTGSFTKLSPEASITDGKFQFIGVRAKSILEIPTMFLKLLTGEHRKDDKNILYLKNDMFHVECLDENIRGIYGNYH